MACDYYATDGPYTQWLSAHAMAKRLDMELASLLYVLGDENCSMVMGGERIYNLGAVMDCLASYQERLH